MRLSLTAALIVALALPACEAVNSIADATGTDLSALSSSDLTAQLQSVAEGFLSERGVTLPTDVQGLLDDLIRGGADGLLQSDFTASSLADAKTNLVTFLEELLEMSGAESGSGALQTTTDVFEQVKTKLCPLAPFC